MAISLSALGTTLLADVGRYGYPALGLGVLLENAGVPVPGETMLLTAAALAARGRLSIFIVAGVAAASAVAGDNIGFAIGRFGGRRALDRWGRYVFMPPERLARMDAFFERRGPVAVFFARFIPALRVVAALVAGSSKLHWLTFTLFNALGAITWAAVVSAIGYLGTDAVMAALPVLRGLHLGLWLMVVVAAAALLVHGVYEDVHERRLAEAAERTRPGRGAPTSPTRVRRKGRASSRSRRAPR